MSQPQRPDSAMARPVAGLLRRMATAIGWLWGSALALATALIAALLWGGWLCQWVSPLRCHYVQYLGTAFPLLYALGIAWSAVLALMHRWRTLVLPGLTLLLLSGLAARLCPLHVGGRPEPLAQAPGRTDSLRVLTYNTCSMGRAKLWQKDGQVPVVDALCRSGADVICLQEYAFSASQRGWNETRMRERFALAGYPHYYYLPNAKSEIIGVALFARHPIVRAERIDPRERGYVSAIYCQLSLPGGRRLGVVDCHLHTNSIDAKDRILADEMIAHFSRDSLGRIRTGLIRQLGRGFRYRATESQIIARYVAEHHPRGVPLVVCGDFNDTPVSYCYHTLRSAAGLSDTWADAGRGPGISYHEHHFWFRIDHILHSRHLRALHARVRTDWPYSDHYPVEATFQLLADEGR